MAERTRYRLIALDLDGTTLDPRGKVALRTREAIHEVLARGTYVCFATGRNFTESRPVLEQVGHFASAVFVGGASVVDTAKGVSLRSQTMRPTLAQELSGLFESMGHAVLALEDTFTTGVDYLISENLPLNAATQKWLQATKASVRRVPHLATYEHDQTLRVGIVAPREEAAQVNALLQERYVDRVTTHSISIPVLNVDVIEVFDPAVTKWTGIQYVASDLNIPGEQIITVGDDLNDLPMLRQAGLGVAMGNAHPEAKAAAQLTIGTNAEDGLAQFLETLIENDQLIPV